ncbi:hypothetical protein CC1G_07850 [Coprinopsis cinerea okayama7|uniref:Uncharacterized protein n=1 Tax=Coprinopsis cinerea (strain Okayama-7 / 130 / ATCC MYA-4618 / FGSC 9003) TaxID=240176 RepID=A8P420_COPC7|nr:hypothetical protein CC1G_07850 [Coprinopsis cinerea okayama7\|eukprot:XP_001838659.1 hypothetical protein CC1G_07850 [Coprinopsis cinerea okayama7\
MVAPSLPLELVFKVQDHVFESVKALHGRYCCPLGSALNSSTSHTSSHCRSLTEDVYNFSLVSRSFRSRSISHIFHKITLRKPHDLVEVHRFLDSLVCAPSPPVDSPVSVVKAITIDFDIDKDSEQEELLAPPSLIQLYASSITEYLVKWTTEKSLQEINQDAIIQEWLIVPFTFRNLIESAVAKQGSLVSLSLHRICFPRRTLNRIWSPQLRYLELKPQWYGKVLPMQWLSEDQWNDVVWARELDLGAIGQRTRAQISNESTSVDVSSSTIRFDTRVLKCDASYWVLEYLEGSNTLSFPNGLRLSFKFPHLHTLDLVDAWVPSLGHEIADQFHQWLVKLDAPNLTTIRLSSHWRWVWFWAVASCFRHVELVQRPTLNEKDRFPLGYFVRNGPQNASRSGLNTEKIQSMTVIFSNDWNRGARGGIIGAGAMDAFLSPSEKEIGWEILSGVVRNRTGFPSWRCLTFDLRQLEGLRGEEIVELEREIIGRLRPGNDFAVRVVAAYGDN